MAAIHPGTQQLSFFALGRLSDNEARLVADHVSSCPECEAALGAVPDDRILSLIRVGLACREPQQPETAAAGHGDGATGSYVKRPPEGAGGTPNEPRPGANAQSSIYPAISGYHVLGLLGTGGMGVVYRAYHLGLKREVALKVLRQSASPAMRERFQVEAEAVARLQHPHIVQIHEIGQWQPPDQPEPAPYFAMEYVPGGSLDRLLKRGPLPAADAAQLLEVLARAVQAAHAAGIVHRDLKPANVLLAEPVPGNSGSLDFGFPKIADFGLARHVDAGRHQTVTGQVMGTPAYMAPEQAESRPDVGPAADVWALGVILYQCLTAELPFKGTGPDWWLVLDQVRQATPVPPQKLRPEVPEELQVICLRCLNKDPAQRYPAPPPWPTTWPTTVPAGRSLRSRQPWTAR